ncbi:hypothetical protein PR048_002681 [Dryococelus australis]|uniref:Mutator-like transposase domain-containing protein n=1 Tax=Dryococelus australis TaxID=614101 RepID=A0ABQ9IKU8_9NEOP|nr:hypothetical protein PR048_002681 [Dryococelus australis]
MSENRENKKTYLPINETAVHIILATGGGYSQLREFSAGVDIHRMSNKIFLKHMKVSRAIDDAALQSMIDAAEEEKERIRYCSICASCYNATQIPPSHTCFLDWKKKVRPAWKQII